MIGGTLSIVQSDILDAYYSDNARKLHRVVDKILSKFGGLSNKDTDDFYSLANEVFTDVLKRYDHVQPFDGFLYSCLSKKIMSEITRRNREKRKTDRMAVSLDKINEDSDTFEEASGKLSNQQVNILNLLVDGYKPNEIRQILEISPKKYAENLKTMRSYENIKIFIQEK